MWAGKIFMNLKLKLILFNKIKKNISKGSYAELETNFHPICHLIKCMLFLPRDYAKFVFWISSFNQHKSNLMPHKPPFNWPVDQHCALEWFNNKNLSKYNIKEMSYNLYKSYLLEEGCKNGNKWSTPLLTYGN